jgi:hypothetical protein
MMRSPVASLPVIPALVVILIVATLAALCVGATMVSPLDAAI